MSINKKTEEYVERMRYDANEEYTNEELREKIEFIISTMRGLQLEVAVLLDIVKDSIFSASRDSSEYKSKEGYAAISMLFGLADAIMEHTDMKSESITKQIGLLLHRVDSFIKDMDEKENSYTTGSYDDEDDVLKYDSDTDVNNTLN